MKVSLGSLNRPDYIDDRDRYFNVITELSKRATRVQICTYGITDHARVVTFLLQCPKLTRVLVGLPYRDPEHTIEYIKYLRRTCPNIQFRVSEDAHAKFVRFELKEGFPRIVVGSHNLTGGQSEEVSIVTTLHHSTFLTTFNRMWQNGSIVRISRQGGKDVK
jgi:hypothetical protein